MCGFVGFIHGETPLQYENVMKQMLNTIIHRGPDGEGIYSDERLTLGLRRLNLSEEVEQPITSDGENKLVFNGKIYNYKEIREQLEELGHTFQTNTDSELLLKGYNEFGVDILQKIRGVFAFCIWDKKRDVQLLARDIFGVKPLFYTQNTTDGSILFGSEIKSLLPHPSFKKELNKDALRPYLTFQHSSMEETFFKGVYKLTPGSYMTIQNGQMNIQSYWEFQFKETSETLDVHVKNIQKVLKESVDLHKESDVEVASFLSGGIDSSYVAKLAQPKKTYSVGFKGYESIFDETSLAKALSEELNFENKQKHLTADECFQAVPTIQWHMDEPQSNLSSVPLYFLSEMASKDVSIVLSGEGADELFAGYEWYKPSEKMEKYKKVPVGLRKMIAKIANAMPENRYTSFLQKGALPVEQRFIGQAFVWDEQDALEVLKEDYRQGPSIWDIVKPYYDKVKGEDDTTKMQYLDLHVWNTGDILVKADRMSMAHSLEVRMPFLDREVFKVASRIATKYKVSPTDTKIALRKAALEELPEEWAKRKKVGFPVPVRHWLKEEKYYNLVRNTFEQPYVGEFFNQARLINYLVEHYEGKANHARYIWTVYVFCIWYEQFFPEKCGLEPLTFNTAQPVHSL